MDISENRVIIIPLLGMEPRVMYLHLVTWSLYQLSYPALCKLYTYAHFYVCYESSKLEVMGGANSLSL